MPHKRRKGNVVVHRIDELPVPDLTEEASTKVEKSKSSSSRKSKKKQRIQEKNITKKEQVNNESTQVVDNDNMELQAAVDMPQWLTVGIDLHPKLLLRLYNMGFTSPTPIQRAMLPKAMVSLKDVIAAAETGSGKTLSYGLPILDTFIRMQEEGIDGSKGERRRRYVYVLLCIIDFYHLLFLRVH